MDTSHQDEWFETNRHPFAAFNKAHHNSVECIQFNPTNPQELASGSHDKLLKIWDVQKMKQMGEFKGHTEGVWALAYTPDGKTIITGSPDRTLLVWDPKKGKPISQLKEHKNKIYWVRCSDDGKWMVSGGEDGRLIVWDLKKMSLLKVVQAAIKQLIIVEEKNKILRKWGFDSNLKKMALREENIVHMDCVTALAISKNTFATGARDGAARVWTTETQDGKHKVIGNLLDHTQKISAIQFMPKTSNFVATSSWDQNINFYKI